jgi:HAD superfamily hydrolase (TIGR01549 family)
MRDARWLFFDLGNTLISEEAAVDCRIRRMICSFERYGRRVSFEQVESALQQAWAQFSPRVIAGAIEMLTDDPELRRSVEAEALYPKELEKPYEDAEKVLQALSAHYRIGVIANQSAGAEARLTRWGLMPFISICISSAEAGVEKPDPAIFRLALAHAHCEPRHAVMIGDRLDNDIRPARLLGWKTIRVLQGFARFQCPRDKLDEADATIASLTELLSLFPTGVK